MHVPFVYSSFAADPDFGELVEMFVEDMSARIDAIETQARSRNWDELTRIAHQIKGAAGSYVFDAVTPCALRLETAAKECRQEEEILLAVKELVDLCRRLRAGMPPQED